MVSVRVWASFALVAIASALASCAARPAPTEPARPAEPAPAPPPAAEPAPAPPPRPELPLGGREIFPSHRLVGYCGTPGAPALGKLAGNLPARAKEIEALAKKYDSGRKVLPVFELIAVVVQGVAGDDGKYRRRVGDAVVKDYLKAARASKALLLLNVQPGHSDFMTEVKVFEPYLREPDVGIALDPEWAMKPKQKPGKYYGQATGDTVNEVAEYLSGIVKQHDLPEKALVVHQMNQHVFKGEEAIKTFPGVALIKSIDGLGPSHTKVNTYNYLMKRTSPLMRAGFKLFFQEDTENGRKLMTPQEVLALKPQPEYVMYE